MGLGLSVGAVVLVEVCYDISAPANLRIASKTWGSLGPTLHPSIQQSTIGLLRLEPVIYSFIYYIYIIYYIFYLL